MKRFNSLVRANDPDRLYIFVTSWQPDPYVNVLVHSLRHFVISHIYFVSIVEHDYVPGDDEDKADRSLSEIRAGVEGRLRELARGVYTRSPKPNGSREEVEIGPDSAALYGSCLSMMEGLEVTSVTFRWADLDRRLALYSANGNGIFDVTALKNNLLVDVVVGLLSRGSTRIFAFEILKEGRRSYDERELIHSLKERGNLASGDYVYRNLLENPNVKNAIGRIVSRSLQVRSLIILTSIAAVIIVFIQIFYPNSWPETAVAVVAAIAAISGWAASLGKVGK